MIARSEQAWRAFRDRVSELGGRVLEPEWLGGRVPHRICCAKGHMNSPRPDGVLGGQGICRTCAGCDSKTAEATFRARVSELSGTVLEETWLGTGKAHRVRCADGHETTVRPSNLQRELCKVCAGRSPVAAEADFRARVAEMGGTILEPTWLGSRAPHRVICAAGHECNPRPNGVQQGWGICLKCRPKHYSAEAAAAFYERVEQLGGTVLEPTWLGRPFRHRVRCAQGHEIAVWPRNLTRNQTLCRLCDPLGTNARKPRSQALAAEAAFRARVEELDGVVLESKWLGSGRPHRVRCRSGHICRPRPNSVQQGGGLCIICAGRDLEKLWQAFKERVAELGGTVLEPEWLGSDVPHRIRCAEGHERSTRPNGVARGRGICRTCAGCLWDVFYVLADQGNASIKFGITSGDPRPRLQDHARAGFTTLVRLLTGLPDAFALERDVKATLALAGEKPVRGREYFDVRVLATVLDVVDHYLVTAAIPNQRGEQAQHVQ